MSDNDIDRRLAEWFQSDALAQAPTDGVDRALDVVRRSKPRPRWLAAPGSHWGWQASHSGSSGEVRVLSRSGMRWSTAFVLIVILGVILGGAMLVGASLLESRSVPAVDGALELLPDDRPAFPESPAVRAGELPASRLGHLAYAVDGDIFVADWDGQNPVRIADGVPGGKSGCGSAGFWAEGPMWSPDGRFLAYRSPRSQVQCDRPESDTIPTVLLSDPAGRVVAEFQGVGWVIPWSPDSTRVATWLDLYPSTRIGVYGLDGERQAVLTLPPGLTVSLGDIDPVWSPDGESILVALHPNPKYPWIDSTVWELPLDGSPPRRLPANHPRFSPWSSYSPDRARAAYVGLTPQFTVPEPPEGGPLIVAAADGSQPRELFSSAIGNLAWSPTGDRIAFVIGDGTELRVIDVASGAMTTLVRRDGREGLSVLDFSPEGDRILFARDDPDAGTSSIWTVDASGSEPELLNSDVHWATGDWQSLPADAPSDP